MSKNKVGTSAGREKILASFKRRLAEVLVRSKINCYDDLRLTTTLWNKHGIERVGTAADIQSAWQEFFSSARWENYWLQLYLNIPFCKDKCSFCKFPVRIESREDALERYVDDVIKEMEYFSPMLSKGRFMMFQVGGGTPSLLSKKQMERLLSTAFYLFRIRDGREGYRTIEFHPADASLEKLRVAREMGFHRVSFGVQSLNRDVLNRIHRGVQTEEMVCRAVRQASGLGFECVSVELVLGLKGETVKSFMQSAVKLLEERPTSLCVNQLNLVQDYMTEENIDPEQYFAWRREFLPEICEALKLEAARRGYSTEYISPTRGIWTLSRGDDFYSNALGKNYCEPFSTVLGIGQRAFSQIRGQVWYERVYSDFSTDHPIYKMRRRTLDTEAAEYTLFGLINYSEIEFKPFFDVFGIDLRKHYELELKILASLRKIRMGSDGFKFLPTDLRERFFYGSVFFLRQWANLSAGKALLGEEFLDELKVGLS